MVKKNSIPERWRSLTAIGQRVPGSRFIAFKVPLKGVTNQRVTQNQKFTPKDLVTAIRSQNEELGLIIDLTNTERYYTTKDLPKSILYVKLHTAGLKIPDDATIHQFKRVVWKFLAANSDNDRLIGVHCTTGINRTGYLICRYLIDVDGWRPLHALSAFSQARGHPIEGTVYIEDIVKGPPRSNVGIDLPPTIDETRAMDNGSDDLPRNRGQRENAIKSLLELIPGNEYVDFDARDQRPLPLMRGRSDEYQEDSREFFNPRPEFRGGRLPPGDMEDDLDLPFEHRDLPFNMPEHPNVPERFRRPGDFNLENRRGFSGFEPRPLMDVRENYGPRDMQRPRGMPHEQMGYDDRMRGRQSPMGGFHEFQADHVPSYPPGEMNNAEYDDIEAEGGMRPLNTDFEFRERMRRQQFQSMENENQRFDPREREMMNDSFKGPFNERMHPRNARTLEGPINDRTNIRSTQLLGELMNEILHQKDRRDMDGPINERIHPRNANLMEGSVNERFQKRDAQGIINLMDEMMNLKEARPSNVPMTERIQSRNAQLMDGPMNNRMYSRDARQIEASTNNERMQPRVARLMDLPMNERLNPRDGQAMDNSMNDRIPPRDFRAINRPMNERMNPADTRSMEVPLNVRMHPRIDRAMEGTMNDQMHPRPGAMNDQMHPRPGAMNDQIHPRPGAMNDQIHPRPGAMNDQIHPRPGAMNERMPLRDARGMEGLMNERMYQRDARGMQGPMNEQMHQRDARTMEAPMNERMYPHNAEFPSQRDFMNETRPFEGRKMNPSEDSLRGANRFAPYPSLMKSVQPAEIARGPPRHDNRDPREMFPPSQDATRFPLRNRFN
ncbi:uncharacterized protein LOC142664197 isoform X2 [Rhinoderma darwinii]|uniref:uncharacterized protein LOC142664197 isoform X2 n=1 Tax=Rhinoderma darwinii TaxID=43563 RepID=UPI003F679DE4